MRSSLEAQAHELLLEARAKFIEALQLSTLAQEQASFMRWLIIRINRGL